MLDLQIYDLLRRLENDHANGFPWVGSAQFQDIPVDKQSHAVSAGYVKEKGFGNIRQYRLTEIGKNEANFTATELLRRMQSDSDDLGSLDADLPDQRGYIRSLIQPLGEPVVIHAAPSPDWQSPNHSISQDAADVYLESIAEEIKAAKPVGTRRALSAKTCCVPGCDQLRYHTATKQFTRCEEHQKAYWREKQQERTGATQSHVAIVEPPVTEEDTQVDIVPVVVHTPDLPLQQVASAAPVVTRALARAAIKFIMIAKGG